MIVIRVAQQECIDIRPSVLIPLQTISQILGDITRHPIRVFSVLPNVYVDQQGGCVHIAKLDEGHIPVVYGKNVMVVGIWVSR